jgi:predicted nucleic acid-binding protein
VLKEIILDIGPITLMLTKDSPKRIKDLFTKIKSKLINAYVVRPVLIEVYKHLCIANGKNFAQSGIIEIMDDYPLKMVEIDKSLIIKAGSLKCSYRTKLSYIDCIVIAFGLLNKLEIHTTEKNFPNIPKLKITPYHF